jgi:hypothetical protein
MLDVSRELAQRVGWLLSAHRRAVGTPRGSRALTCFWQAVLVLAWFRTGDDIGMLGLGAGISRATAYRYISEGIAVLAALAPDLHEALHYAKGQGMAYVILDGTEFAIDRCLEKTTSVKGESIDLWYSGKDHRHTGNVQAISAPNGMPLWLSPVSPGSVHDITAARTHVLPALYAAAANGLPTLADPGYDGAGIGVHTPVKQPTNGAELDIDTRTRNMLLRSLRCIGERGFAVLEGRWRTLRRITASPSKITDIARAALVLTQLEHRYLQQIR